MKKNIFRTYVTALAAIFSFAVFTQAQMFQSALTDVKESASSELKNSAVPGVKIRNFGKMDDRIYRGGQPLPDEFAVLKELGINTVVDLQDDPTDYEKPAVEAAGMKYVNIPMSGWRPVKDSSVQAFMNLVNDPSSGVLYIHCKAGKHRTGLMGAIYRMEKYGWSFDQAYTEMKSYGYSTWPVYGQIKDYVRDYSKELKTRNPVTAVQTAAAQAN